MEYTVAQLARLSGVSARTLRYYDQIGLLKPAYINASGYRVYGEKQVNALQQILFFKELGLELNAIGMIMQDARFDRRQTLRQHLCKLQDQQKQLNLLIENVQKTLQQEEGMLTMLDEEKFQGLKKRLLEDNEAAYGAEIREKYGTETVERSNRHFMQLTEEQYAEMGTLTAKLHSLLAQAVRAGNPPQGETGRQVATLHKRWLGFTWPTYSKEAHIGLMDLYTSDPRFTAHYDHEVAGCAQFLSDAVKTWAGKI